MISKRIFVSAGEPSGDEALGSILQEMQLYQPKLKLFGLGGPACQKQGLQPLFPMERTGVNGVWDVLANAIFLLRMVRRAKREMIQCRPDLVLLVDYPGLNLRLAQKARAMNLRVLFVAPPQLWVYKKATLRRRRTLHALQGCAVHVLFPFEAMDFSQNGGTVTVGHFYSTKAQANSAIPTQSRLSSGEALSLFPGSRLPVIFRNLSLWISRLGEYYQTVEMREGKKEEIRILVPGHLQAKVAFWLQRYKPEKQRFSLLLCLEKKALLASTDYAIAFPGTMTLELFLQGIPTLVLTSLDAITLALGRRLLNSTQLSLPNLLLKESVFPEWAGNAAELTNEKFAHLIQGLKTLNPPWERLQNQMQSILGTESGSKAAAQAGLKLLNFPVPPLKGFVPK